MDAPVASKIIVSFHQPYFRPHARSKQKVPPSVSELYPKPKREIIHSAHFMSTFSSTNTKLIFRTHRHFYAVKFKQSKACKSSVSLYCAILLQSLCLNLLEGMDVQEWDPLSGIHWFLCIKQFKIIINNYSLSLLFF